MDRSPKNLSISSYTYSLPEEKIALYPLPIRSHSKLLLYDHGIISEDIYENIDSYIPEGSLMLFNNTRVIAARLLFQKPTGGVIEIFCLEPHEDYAEVTTAMQQTGSVKWLCLIGGASKWKHGQILERTISYNKQLITLSAKYIEKRSDCFVIELNWNIDISFAEILHIAGQIPLPPYIKRDAEGSDAERYQTVYARYNGSVAAPTAGLHFTEDILKNLKEKNIATDFITLHVGAGTFKPVKSETMQGHEMHAEYIEITAALIENILQHRHKKIIAVGTTSLRTLESLYWLGCKLIKNKNAFLTGMPFISQWEAYDYINIPTAEVALENLLEFIKQNKNNRLIAKTQILIAPGYRFQITDGLVTNFHQPLSTLLLLVAAFIGEDWKKVYDYALSHDFRFLSYGDGSLLWRKNDE